MTPSRQRPASLRSRLTEALFYQAPHPWSRPLLRRLGRRAYADRGIFLGRAFRWSPKHTQELESHVRDNAAPLPTGTDTRGGIPGAARRRHQAGATPGAAVE